MTDLSIRRQIQKTNWQRAPLFFFLMLALEPFNIVIFDLPRLGGSFLAPLYLILHTALFLMAAAALLYWALWIRPGRWKSPALVEGVTALIGTTGLALIAAATVVDMLEGGGTTPFLANLLICAALALVPFRWAVMVYSVPTAVFLAGTLWLQTDSVRLANDLSNGAVFLLAALLIARFQYKNEVGLLVKNAELDFLSHHDPLTGLANRSQFQEKVQWQLAALQRSGGTASLVLVDLDRFKTINDRFGHPVGDRVLKETARVLHEGIRGIDCACRWGGEEFLLLLSDTPAAEAGLVAERLRSNLAGTPAEGPEGEFSFTASFGVAALLSTEAAFQDAYARADEALYRAKEGGRNRVEVSPAASVSA